VSTSRISILAGLCLLLAAAGTAPALAQGSGQGPRGPQGGAQQQGPHGASEGGGSGSSSSQQGSAGSQAQQGTATGSGIGQGAGSVFQNKFNYWGGRRAGGDQPPGGDEPPGGDDTTGDDTASSDVPSGTGGSDLTDAAASSYGASCTADTARELSFDQRFESDNLVRLYVAGAYLAPVVTQAKLDGTGSPLLNLAYYQAAAAQTKPDLLLAGTYLGLVTERPMTESVVERVNRVLCLSLTRSQAANVARISEGQRQYSATHMQPGQGK